MNYLNVGVVILVYNLDFGHSLNCIFFGGKERKCCITNFITTRDKLSSLSLFDFDSEKRTNLLLTNFVSTNQ